MDIYFELFPEIKKWHNTVLAQTDKDGYARNPFGYVHRFYNALSWESVYGKWQSSPGSDANRVIAFLPQSTAAGIIKEAMLRLYFNHYDAAGQYLRLLVHDELFFEVPEALLADVDALVQSEMEQPVPELALPSYYGMGDSLSVLTEAKKGKRWGSMK
jgi:DNA polymerase I-like protein with 3'-5' exonuclease and polymerase domains